jgi:hypothetical protein
VLLGDGYFFTGQNGLVVALLEVSQFPRGSERVNRFRVRTHGFHPTVTRPLGQ